MSAAMKQAEKPLRFTLWDLTDDALAGVAVSYRRQLEDFASGRAPGVSHIALTRRARILRQHQLSRFCLRMRYGARDDGTDIYDRWYRLGEPPSYVLAAEMDRWKCQNGQRSALAWPDAKPLEG